MVGRDGFEPAKRENAVDLQSTPFSQTWIPTHINFIFGSPYRNRTYIVGLEDPCSVH